MREGSGWVRVTTGRVVLTATDGGTLSLSVPGEEASIRLTFTDIYIGDEELNVAGRASLGKSPWQLRVVQEGGDVVEFTMKKRVEVGKVASGGRGMMGHGGGMPAGDGEDGGSVEITVSVKVYEEPREADGMLVGGPEEVKIDISLSPEGVEGERLYLEQHLGEEGLSGSERELRCEMRTGTRGEGRSMHVAGESRELFRCRYSSGMGSVAYRLNGGEDIGEYIWMDRVVVNDTEEERLLPLESFVSDDASTVLFAYPLQNVSAILQDPILRLDSEAMKRAIEEIYREVLEHLYSIALGVAAGVTLLTVISAYVRARRRRESPLSNPYLREPPRLSGP